MSHLDGTIISIPIRVYYEDTDLGGVVYYANYLKYFERARTEWLRNIGISNSAMLQSSNTAFVISECSVKYLAPAKMDDLLNATIDRFIPAKASAVIHQSVLRAGQPICTATMKLACIDVATGNPVRLPAVLRIDK
jgi:acyl-CoA thioester hydrolase